MKKNLYFLNSIKEKLFKSKLLFIALLCTVLQALVFQVRAQANVIIEGNIIEITYIDGGTTWYMTDLNSGVISNPDVVRSTSSDPNYGVEQRRWRILDTHTITVGTVNYIAFKLVSNSSYIANPTDLSKQHIIFYQGTNGFGVDYGNTNNNTELYWKDLTGEIKPNDQGKKEWCVSYVTASGNPRFSIENTKNCITFKITPTSLTVRYPYEVVEGDGTLDRTQMIPTQVTPTVNDLSKLYIQLVYTTDNAVTPTPSEASPKSIEASSFNFEDAKYVSTSKDLKINFSEISSVRFRKGGEYLFQIKQNNSSTPSNHLTLGVFRIKVVPDYLEWNPKNEGTPTTPNYSISWNNDDNWSAVAGPVPNDAIDGFVPAYWTNVKMPKKKNSYPILNANIEKAVVAPYTDVVFYNMSAEAGKTSSIDTEWEYWPYAAEHTDYYPRPFRPNWCKNIYFEHGKVIDGAANDEWGAELAHTNYLNYTTAYVDMTLRDNRWYMVSAPLGYTYTGDMHLPKSNPNYDNLYPWLSAADANDWVMFGNVPVVNNRAQPIVYQRVWDKVTVNKPPLAGAVDDEVHAIASTGNWTKAFNALNHKHLVGNGFAVGVDMSRAVETPNYGSYDVTFKFPKIEESYRYYNIDGNYPVGSPVTTPRSSVLYFGSVGKFAYTPDNTASTEMGVTLTSENNGEGSTLVGNRIFLVGNPFMSHLDWEKFLAVNTELKNLYWIYDGTKDNIKTNPVSLTDANDYVPTGTNYIAPMQSFFVMLKDGVAAKTSLNIKFTSDMMVTKPQLGARLKVAQTRSTVPADLLQIYASRATSQTMAVIVKDARASNDYDGEEDAESIFNAFYPSTPIVYTVAGEKALLKNVMNDPGRVPVGIHTEKEGEVTFLFEGLAGFSNEIIFYDALKQKEYPLDATHNSVVIPDVSSGLGRFFLDFKAVASGVEETATDQLRIYNPEKGKIVISAGVGDKIESVEIYSLSGQLVHSKYQIDKDLTEIGVEGGVYTAKVKTLNNSKACKVIVK